MSQEQRNFFDDLNPYDPVAAETARLAAAVKGEHLDNLIHRAFEQSDAGKELLALWKESLIMSPTAEPGMGLLEVGVAEGMKRFIRSIILTVKRVEKE